jgi:hypothetical protein
MAVRFDADGEDYTSSPLGLTTSPLTALCWVKVMVSRAAISTYFCLDDGTTTNAFVTGTTDDGTSTQGFFYPDANSLSPDLNSGAQTVGTWYRVAITSPGVGSNVTLYHGAATGAFDTDATGMSINTAGLSTLRFGESVWTGEWFNGSIANFKLYSAVLTVTEMEAEFNSWDAVRTSNLVRHHKFKDGPSTADDSGNGRTLSGGTGTSTDTDNPPIGAVTTSGLYPTASTETGTTWANQSNAYGSTTGNTATRTTTTSGAVATFLASGYDAQTAMGGVQPASISSVSVTVRSYVTNNASRYSSLTAQLYSGSSTAIGSAQSLTISTSTANFQTLSFTGANLPTWAQMADLRVNLSGTKSGTQASVWNIDTVGPLTITYLPAEVPAAYRPPAPVVNQAALTRATSW